MNNRELLYRMSDLLEATDSALEFEETIEQARLTADMNPTSETAEDLIDEMFSILSELSNG